MEVFKNLINNNFFKSFHAQKMAYASNVMKELVFAIQNHLKKFRNDLFKESIPDYSASRKNNFEDFNKTMDEIVTELDKVENVRYEKLEEIKVKNENLLLIQNHIVNL